MNHRLLVDYEVIELLEMLPRKDQQRLRNRFLAIQNDPQSFSDYLEQDSASRRIDVNLCGKFAIKFWQDHAGRHLKILEVVFADVKNH